MIKQATQFAAIFATLMAMTTAVSADPIEDGARIYAERCSVCHGATGGGDGAVGELFAIKPRDLTRLAADNNNVFPFSEVYQAVDGRRVIAGHGGSEMPVWGTYFMADAIDDPTINDKNARYITQGRVLALVYYLQSIQTN